MGTGLNLANCFANNAMSEVHLHDHRCRVDIGSRAQ
jgi:hypothetical protein